MLEGGAIAIQQVRSVRKEPFTDKEVRELLAEVSTVILSKGRQSIRRKASEVSPAELKGPTGNYRSPIVRRGKLLLVGFNEEALKQALA